MTDDSGPPDAGERMARAVSSHLREREHEPRSGGLALLVGLAIIAGGFATIAPLGPMGAPFAAGGTLLGVLVLAGLFVVHPNEAKVLQLFGRYIGTVRAAGLAWANPFYSKTRVSTRVRNFETGRLKVNDHNGNPIEIGAVVVWKVEDTAEAQFNVDDFVNFVHVQSEAALRALATGYPYESYEGGLALSSHTAEISDELRSQVQKRLAEAGISVIEARISHLAYSPEIAAAMLQRQQASAVVAARQKIVEGAVGMVESALQGLAAGNVVELDDERKAAMVTNLLVVLCGDRTPQPVVNAGSLYH
jgi:regulator of protease activity HflC (stomatin/prohibitin superfamily)